jgi:hypothetical protein
MKLKDAVGLGKACGLKSLEEYVLNIELHCMNLFLYDDVEKELAELNAEAKNAKECYQCGDPVMWLAPDSRCGDCTGYTPDEIVNGRQEVESKDNFISVYMPIAGWKAIEYYWDTEYGGYWAPEQTGSFAYFTKAEAIQEARQWAKDAGLEYRDTDPDATADAPKESMTEQLEAMGFTVVKL